MHTEVDLAKLTPYQREVLTALVRPLSKDELMRLLQIVEATTVISEATMQTILDRAKAIIEELERVSLRNRPVEPARSTWAAGRIITMW